MKIVLCMIIILLAFPLDAIAVDIKYAGCVTIKEAIMKDAKNAFEKKTGLSIGLSGGGAGAGIKAVLSGLVDIGGVSRALKEDEINQGLVAYTVGYTAVAVVTNKKVNLDNLSMSNLKQLLSGKIKNWNELGGPDLPVKVVIPSKGYASRDEVQRFVLKDEQFAQDAIITPEQTLSETLESVEGAIGIVDISMVEPGKVKILKLDGLAPNREAIKSKKYKLVIPINIVTKGQATGRVKEFIDFLLSPEGQSIVEKRLVGIK